MSNITVNSNFEKWIQGFSGCDGGNLKGPLWFCGIEWAGDVKVDWLNKNIHENVTTPNFLSDPHDIAEDTFKYPYNVKLLKMYSALLTEDVSQYKDVAIKYRYLSKVGHLFKMNLYPISFKDTGNSLWSEDYYKATGLPTKVIYKEWCEKIRFKHIHGWVKQNHPKAIICTGVTLLNEFVKAFGGIENYGNNISNKKIVTIENRYFHWMPINNGENLLFVTPFFGGRYGLNADIHLTSIGEEIRKICNQHFGENWLNQM